MKQFDLNTLVFALLEESITVTDLPVEFDHVTRVCDSAGKVLSERKEAVTTILQVPSRTLTLRDGWYLVEDEQVNQISASITGGGQIWVEGDQIKYSGAQPTPAHTFDQKTGKWVLDKAKQAELDAQAAQAVFDTAKVDKASEINTLAQSYIDHATGADQLPAFEVQSWAIQGAEAKAWKADPSAPTPTLESIAKNRGVPLDALRAGAYKKTMMYEGLVAAVTGQRQKYNDQLRAAKTLAEIESINVIYG